MAATFIQYCDAFGVVWRLNMVDFRVSGHYSIPCAAAIFKTVFAWGLCILARLPYLLITY